MLRKLLLASLLAVLIATTSSAYNSRICLKPGSYVITKSFDDIFVMKMNGALVTEVRKIHIDLPEAPFSENITANGCNILFDWFKGGWTNIYRVNPATGSGLRNVTRVKEAIVYGPVLEPDGYHFAYTEFAPDGTRNVMLTDLSGERKTIMAKNASAPAWPYYRVPSYTDEVTGRIIPWNATGSWHTYLPDQSGALIQDNLTFTVWPVVGTTRKFASYIFSVAFGPYTPGGPNYAAIVNSERGLEFWELDRLWMPTGIVIAGPGLPGLEFVTWIEVKGY